MSKKKTKQQTTISFLLDRTGSMQTIKDDVIGGFNQFISEQKKHPGKCTFILTLFDSQSVDTESYDISDVPELTNETYVPRASTPLLDAIGKTIHATGDPEGRVLFVIYTDGFENSSREYTREAVQKLVKEKEAKEWDFLFLGADIDAYGEAMNYGIGVAGTVSVAGAQGPPGSSQVMFAAASDTASSYRSGSSLNSSMDPLRTIEDKQKKKKVDTKS